MRIGRIGRGVGLALAVLTALSVMALPAVAQAVKGTASIASGQRQVLAGDVGAQFDITISNPAGTGGLPVIGGGSNPAYNAIRIVPPPNAFTATGASGPGDWTARTNSQGHVFFEGDTVPQGQSATFSIVADVTRTGCDLARSWDVYVSDDGGATSVQQDPASPGALRTEIRVLEVIDVQLTGPSGVVDNSATQEQSGITARTTVLNAGSQSLSVSATLGKASGGAGAPTTSPADANPKTIGSQSQGTFNFNVTMGSPGNLVLGGDASVPDCADALNGLSDTISVMTKAAFSYVGGSLQPTHVVPGNPYGFRTNISKSGQVAVSLDLGNSEFRFPAGNSPAYRAGLTDNGQIPGGGQGLTFNFAERVVPLSLADGSYNPEILVVGTDENGAPVGTAADPLRVPVNNTVTLDRLIPVVTPNLTPPSTQVVGADPATTNGATLGFGGTIEDPAGTPCGACTIETAFLRQYDAAGNAIHDQPVTPGNTMGMIGGNYTGNYADGAVSVELHVVVRDQAGNTGPGVSDRVDVDLLAPDLGEAFTGGPSGQDARRVDVFLTELVRAPLGCSSLDWTVDDNVVTASQCQPLPNGHNHVILTLGSEVARDGEPSLTYSPRLGNTNRRLDRVEISLADRTIEIIDGLVPDLPVLEQVSGLTRFDGQFWTNESSPDFLITNVVAGHLIKVWHDVNGNGEIDPGIDREIASGEAQGSSVELESNGSVGTDDGDGFDVPLLVQALDSRLNSSPLASELLTIDQTAPEFDGVAFAGSNVIVTFNEPLRAGRDFGFDWTVIAGEGLSEQHFGPSSVSGDREQRTLAIEHADYESGQVNRVAYEFIGPAEDRYFDRAGNLLADFTASV